MFNPQERHYSVPEVADLLKLSTDVIRKLFRYEPGVIVIYSPKRGCRSYQTLRIPQTVLDRVYDRLRNKLPSAELRLRKNLYRRSPYRGGGR